MRAYVCHVLVTLRVCVQVGFAVADDGAALLGFTNAFNAPGAITISIDTTVDGCASQQLTLVNKASTSADTAIELNSHKRCGAGSRRCRIARSHIGDAVLEWQDRDVPRFAAESQAVYWHAARAAGEVLAIEDSIKRCGRAAAADARRCLFCFTAQPNTAECRWCDSFEAAQGRPPSAGDMVGDAHIVA